MNKKMRYMNNIYYTVPVVLSLIGPGWGDSVGTA